MTQTVLLTGVTGFIAKRIAHDLLDAGYVVRGSLRNANRADEVRAALAGNPNLDKLSFVELDLTNDAGWAEAMQGVDAVIHTASPFPMSSPKEENELIEPAVEGTLRALRAAQAAGVTRVVLTSSMASIMSVDRPTGHKFGPDDWTDVNHPTASAYVKSKTLAEQAAWDFVEKHPEMQLTAINPGLVVGAPLDRNFGTSLELIERMMAGKDPMVPNIGMPIVDIKDVSEFHVKALTTPASIGQRIVAADEFWMLPRIAETLKTAYPERKIATRIAPRLMLKIFSLFDPAIKGILPLLGREIDIDNSATNVIFDRGFIVNKDAILASAAFLERKAA